MRAHRRAADVIRATRAPVAELVRAGRGRELRGIGPGIDARLAELVETGDIAELRELSETVKPELVALGRMLGVSTRRMLEIGEALGLARNNVATLIFRGKQQLRERLKKEN